MGRVDYRRCHLAAYALECQASLHMVHGDAAYQYSQKMLAAGVSARLVSLHREEEEEGEEDGGGGGEGGEEAAMVLNFNNNKNN